MAIARYDCDASSGSYNRGRRIIDEFHAVERRFDGLPRLSEARPNSYAKMAKQTATFTAFSPKTGPAVCYGHWVSWLYITSPPQLAVASPMCRKVERTILYPKFD